MKARRNSKRARRNLLRNTASFAIGAAAGSLATLLYTPVSGPAMRKRLSRRVGSIKRVARRQLGEARRALAVQAESAREAASEWVSEHIPQPNGRVMRRRTLHRATAH